MPVSLTEPLRLPCGVSLKNRIVKAAMSDSLGDGVGNPTDVQVRLYERWAHGGAALSFIGEVQVTFDCPEKPGNLVLVKNHVDREMFRAVAKAGSQHNAHIWPQLGHAGALAHEPISPQAKGPSPLNVEGLKCEGMTVDEIKALPQLYADAASLAKDLGFGGILLHAGHGFLFSQFLSPLFNHRTDSYGGSIRNRFRIVGETIDAVRRAVGPAFPIGIKINSTDKLEGGLTTNDALEVVKFLDTHTLDLIDVSGGTYFPGAASSSDSTKKGPYFLEFCRQAKQWTSIPVMCTGGFTSREQAVSAIQEGAVDVVGLARALVLDPALPNKWMNNKQCDSHNSDPTFPRFAMPLPPGGVTAWYTMRLTALGEDSEDTFDLDLPTALKDYDSRDAERCVRWNSRFLGLS